MPVEPQHRAREGDWGANAPEPVTAVESFGVETIPAEDRTATPFDLFRVAFGGANTFATVVLGGIAFQAPDDKPGPSAPENTTLMRSIFLPTHSNAFSSAAPEMMAVPC